MKILEMTFEDIKTNVKKNHKIVVIVLILSIILGVGFGIINAKVYQPEKKTDVSMLQQHFDTTKFQKDEEYYFKSFFDLKRKHDYISAYLQYFEQVDISNESRARLYSISNELTAYQNTFEEAKEFYAENAPVVFSKADAAVVFYEDKIKELTKDKELKDDELNEIVNGRYTKDYKEGAQKRLSYEISTLQNDIDIYENHKSIISKSSEAEIKEVAETADEILMENSEKINCIIDDFNECINDIAENEQYNIIYNKRLINDYFEAAGFSNEIEQEDILKNKLDSAIVYAKSVAGLDMGKERFFATLTFFLIFGIVISALIGGFYMKESNKND
jgi:hypothetical protein